MTQSAFPFDWFWIVGGDANRAWSSAASAYVTEHPNDRVTRIASEQELSEVLKPYGLAGPVASVPVSVSMFQARAALIGAGLLGTIDAAIAGSGNAVWQAAWEYAIEVRRDSPMIAALAGMLALTSQEIDALFITAGGIQV